MSFYKIASIYDRFNDLSVYEYWLDFTLDSVGEEPGKVVDLGCGTGWFVQLLAPFAKEIIGLDIDPEMLKIAKQENESQENVSFIEGDMTKFAEEISGIDTITCFMDSLCFLPNLSAVEQTFQNVFQALNEEGYFLFDVWTPEQIITGFDGFEYFDKDETAVLLWESEVNQEEISVEHLLTVFEEDDNSKQYRRIETRLIERTYPLSDYLTALEKAGFKRSGIEVLQHYGVTSYHENSNDKTERWFFRVQK